MTSVTRTGAWIFKAGDRATTVSPGRDRVFAFDLEGRPISWFDRDRVFKRSLASEVFGRDRDGGMRRHWQLSTDEAAAAFAKLLGEVAKAPRDGLDEKLGERLDRIARWTPERLLGERERFEAAYEPVGILPPDQYLAVVLQATFGCAWNRCTFCSFYQDRPFRTRDEASFRAHGNAVRDLLGQGVALRRSVFLASGNALVLSDDRLAALLRVARELFPDRPVSSFVDVFTGERRSVESWRELGHLGLERVHIGLETGDDRLLEWLGKPGGAAESLELVSTLKRAGVGVAVILMVGPGGERFAGDHLRSSLTLSQKLPLGHGDLVYLSPFHVVPESPYARRADTEGVLPLDVSRRNAQYQELRDGIRRHHPAVPVSRYDIREFVY